MRNNLKSLMADKGMTQMQMAKALGVSSPTISYWQRSDRLTLDVATRLCGVLGCSLSELMGAEPESSGAGEKIIAVQTELPPPEGYIRVAVYDVYGSCGGGCINSADLVKGSVDLAAWFAHSLPGVTALSGLQIVSSSGDSMRPTIETNSLVLIDTNQRSFNADGVFCLRVEDSVFIKRIMRNLDGSLTLISDNPIYPPAQVSKVEMQQTQILGRVVYVFNGKSL
jgi:phage repressor protein C with HTH and peptisase S24 domain